MPPVRYRYLSHAGIPRVPSVHPVEPWLCGRVCGTLNQPYSETRTRIYIGAFESPIPQGQPVSCCVLDSGGPYRLGGVPPGDWFVLAMAVAVENVDVEPWARRPLYVSAIKPIVSTPGRLLRHDIDMHPTRSVDLPILLALPELDSVEVPGLACRAAL